MSMELRRLSKAFSGTTVVEDVSLAIPSGELAALLGPSGGGKSTILRLIAGLERPDTGEIWLDGRRADGLHARERRVGFVFQHYALFRHMSVAENIAFGLRVKEVRDRELRARVGELVELMGLAGLEHRRPDQLSGGQRQRVALARALAPEPRLLLLDEPFAAIDAKVRQELRGWLRRLHERVGATTVLVTHDRDEAFALADRIIVVHRGRIEQTGTPLELQDDPRSEFVADFLGEVNRFDAITRAGALWIGPVRVPAIPPGGTAVRVIVRSSDVRLWAESPGVAVVDRIIPLGDRLRVEATIDGGMPLFAQVPRRGSPLRDMVPGTRVAVEVTHARAWANE